MARLKACSVCGRIHSADIKCQRKGMPQTQEQALRARNRWKEKSLDIRERSFWLCAICQEHGIYNHSSLEVHHISKLRDNPDGLLDDSNLICLCTEHHKKADAGEIDADHLRKLAQMRDEAKI